MERLPLHSTLHPLLACGLAVLWAGCATGVEPVIGTDLPFTVWGQFNPKTDSHAVRVFTIEQQLRLLEGKPLDATVTSTDRETGKTVVWQDSLVQLANGNPRHVFWATFDAEHNHTYELTVQRIDGMQTRAEVTAPPLISVEVLEPNLAAVDHPTLPVFIHGHPPAMPRLDVEYHARSVPETSDPNIPIDQFRAQIPYAGEAIRKADGWLLTIDLVADLPKVQQAFWRNDLNGSLVTVIDMAVHVHVGDETWVSPVDEIIFDADFLAEPGVFSNTENGFGYVGAGYIETERWTPPGVLLRRAGFSN